MEKKDDFTKILAVAGTSLVWFPILAPVVISTILLAVEGRFLFDYLMPMELFPFVIAGSGLLFWATWRAHIRLKYIVWGIGIAVFMFFGGQWFAEITGLASGETEPAGWMWAIVIASLVLYALGIMLVGICGALLLKDLFKRRMPAV
jgi:hypothetical protein